MLDLFSKYGVGLYPDEIEQLLHLYEGTLAVDDVRPHLLQLKKPEII